MNITREELDFYTEFCVNKDILKYEKLGNKKLAKYEGSTKHLKLPMPKRAELLYLDEQFTALMGREFMKEVDIVA